jgi:hypothetical protein
MSGGVMLCASILSVRRAETKVDVTSYYGTLNIYTEYTESDTAHAYPFDSHAAVAGTTTKHHDDHHQHHIFQIYIYLGRGRKFHRKFPS